MKRGVRPNKAQKRWHHWLAGHGCFLCRTPAEIHHCAGSSAKHNKVHVGQDFCVPLCASCHRGAEGIHGDRTVFAGRGLGESRKEIEKTICLTLAEKFRIDVGSYPFSASVFDAIGSYRR